MLRIFARIILVSTASRGELCGMTHTPMFCSSAMVCDNPRHEAIEICRMPQFFSQCPPLETERMHVHPFYEIVWFRSGSGVHTVDFTDYEVQPATIFFVAPGQLHAFDGTHSGEGYVIKVCAHLLEGLRLKYEFFNAYDSVPYKRMLPCAVARVERIVAMMAEELGHRDEVGHDVFLQSLVAMLLTVIERCEDADEAPKQLQTSTAHRTFLAFRREIEHHYATVHTVKEYAARLNVSTKTLSNYVAACTHLTPLEMINNRIVLEAKRMLRYSDMNVKEIAHELGFEDPSYFNKFFKRLAGCTAAEFKLGYKFMR